MGENSLVGRNTAIMFDEEHNAFFRDLSQKVSNTAPSDIVLNTTDQLPHVSLYNVYYPQKNISNVRDRLRQVVPTLSAFDMHFERASSLGKLIFIDAVISEQLKHMHLAIVDTLNDCREGMLLNGALDDPLLTPPLRQNLSEVGGILVRDQFQPHVTVGHMNRIEDVPHGMNALPRKIDYATPVRSISLVETGPYGTCKRIIETFYLAE